MDPQKITRLSELNKHFNAKEKALKEAEELLENEEGQEERCALMEEAMANQLIDIEKLGAPTIMGILDAYKNFQLA